MTHQKIIFLFVLLLSNYIICQDFRNLKGIKNVNVVVSFSIEDNSVNLGNYLRTKIELRLQQNGIKINSQSNYRINYNIIVDKMCGKYFGVIMFDFVDLRHKHKAVLWNEFSMFKIANVDVTVSHLLLEATNSHLDNFLNDYFKANF